MGEQVEGVYHCLNHGRVSEWDGFEDGDWWIMNPAAAHVVDLVWKVAVSFKSNDLTVLDLCAAPGGKSFRFASKGAKVVSVDGSELRLRRMQENQERLGLVAALKRLDLTEYQSELGSYDVVFVDAPCSGLGVIRKHPEIRWNRTQSDVIASAIRQRQILKHAAKYVNQNGILAYCVCSLHPMEGENVMNAFAAKFQLGMYSTMVDSDR